MTSQDEINKIRSEKQELEYLRREYRETFEATDEEMERANKESILGTMFII